MPNCFYMLKEGKVLLEVDASESISISLGAMKTGFSFGWSSLFPGSTYTATAVCVEPTEVIAIPGKDLVRLMDEDHHNGLRHHVENRRHPSASSGTSYRSVPEGHRAAP